VPVLEIEPTPGDAHGVAAPVRSTSLVADRIIVTTSSDWASITAGELSSSMVVASARLAMNRWAAGGMAVSCFATRYQSGFHFQEGAPDFPSNADCSICNDGVTEGMADEHGRPVDDVEESADVDRIARDARPWVDQNQDAVAVPLKPAGHQRPAGAVRKGTVGNSDGRSRSPSRIRVARRGQRGRMASRGLRRRAVSEGHRQTGQDDREPSNATTALLPVMTTYFIGI